MKAISGLIRQDWPPGEKVVFCTMGPTVALVVYWVSQCLESCTD